MLSLVVASRHPALLGKFLATAYYNRAGTKLNAQGPIPVWLGPLGGFFRPHRGQPLISNVYVAGIRSTLKRGHVVGRRLHKAAVPGEHGGRCVLRQAGYRGHC